MPYLPFDLNQIQEKKQENQPADNIWKGLTDRNVLRLN